MQYFQGFSQAKKALDGQYSLQSCRGAHHLPKHGLQGSFVCVLEDNVANIIVNVATVETNEGLKRLSFYTLIAYETERIQFIFIIVLEKWRLVSFEYKIFMVRLPLLLG